QRRWRRRRCLQGCTCTGWRRAGRGLQAPSPSFTNRTPPMLRFRSLLLGLAFAIPIAQAQTTGTCDHGEAWAELDVNGVRARLFNNGNLFSAEGWDGHYEVPRGSGLHSLWISRLWVGGLVDGQLRISA